MQYEHVKRIYSWCNITKVRLTQFVLLRVIKDTRKLKLQKQSRGSILIIIKSINYSNNFFYYNLQSKYNY